MSPCAFFFPGMLRICAAIVMMLGPDIRVGAASSKKISTFIVHPNPLIDIRYSPRLQPTAAVLHVAPRRMGRLSALRGGSQQLHPATRINRSSGETSTTFAPSCDSSPRRTELCPEGRRRHLTLPHCTEPHFYPFLRFKFYFKHYELLAVSRPLHYRA